MTSRSQSSTIEYYHVRKWRLMREIIRRNGGTIGDDDMPFCEHCRISYEECEELHIDHVEPNGEAGDTSNRGGWQSFYRHKEDFQNGVDLQVLCDICHYLKSCREKGAAVTNLKRRLPYLREYDDKDVGFYFSVREDKHE